MFRPDKFVKQLRSLRGFSQREFSKWSQISFRHVQRIEKKESDMSSTRLLNLIDQSGFEIIICPKIPNWELLCSFGLPLNSAFYNKKVGSQSEIFKELTLAMIFLIENRKNSHFDRHWDSLKGLLLALKTHYPTMFCELKKKSFPGISEVFELDHVGGRHIKLRNIALGLLTLKRKSSRKSRLKLESLKETKILFNSLASDA